VGLVTYTFWRGGNSRRAPQRWLRFLDSRGRVAMFLIVLCRQHILVDVHVEFSEMLVLSKPIVLD
jgi:hypothetical protein